MLGGYNVATLVELLDDEDMQECAAEQLKSTILVFDAFHDVAEKATDGNKSRKIGYRIMGKCGVVSKK